MAVAKTMGINLINLNFSELDDTCYSFIENQYYYDC